MKTKNYFPVGTTYEAHTHTRYGEGFEYFGKTDILNYQKEGNPYGLEGYKIYGWKNIYTLSVNKVPFLTGINSGWIPSNYEPWAISHGLNIGIPHGLSPSYYNLFWFGLR